MIAKKWDGKERQFVVTKGWSFDEEGRIVIPEKDARRICGHSIRNKSVRTLIMNGIFGIELLFEGQHFVIKQ